MQVSKKSFDEGLQSFVFSGNMLAALISRKWGVNLFHSLTKMLKGKNIKGLHCEERYIPSRSGGDDIRVRIFNPENFDGELPGMLYNHGGGYMLGVPELSLELIEQYIKTRACVIVAPDYRKSVKHPFPAGFNDCYDTLLWMKENASSLGIRPSKFIIAGHSAGGGLTAAVSLKARDTGDADIAFQMPIYPMIDHRQETESAKTFTTVPVWNGITNKLAWDFYLQDQQGKVPVYASPSLNKDYKDFPPTISFVGDMEPFKDETIEYIEMLKKFNVPTKFELYKGAFHGFEAVVKNAPISKRANKFQFEAYAEFYDKYAP